MCTSECYVSRRSGGCSITSPNYPNLYDHSTDCEWLLTAEPGYTVEFTITDFDFDDYLLVSVNDITSNYYNRYNISHVWKIKISRWGYHNA